MSLGSMLANPTRNSAWAILPKSSVEGVAFLAVVVAMSLFLLLFLKEFLPASLNANILFGFYVGTNAREQLTCPFTACVPNHQAALRRHVVVIGMLVNVVLVTAALLAVELGWRDKLVMAEMMLLGGFLIYFATCRLLLGMRSMGNFLLLFVPLMILLFMGDMPPLFEQPVTEGPDASPISLMTPAGHVLLVALSAVSFVWFWRLLGKPKHFRRIMPLPAIAGFDSVAPGHQLGVEQTEMQRSNDSSVARLDESIAGVGIPGHGCVVDHLNIVLGRTLYFLLWPPHWVIVAMICIGYPLVIGTGGDGSTYFILFCHAGLMFFSALAESIEVSPLLPYSRTDRVLAMAAASLLSLLFYLGWFVLVYHGTVGVWLLAHGTEPEFHTELPLLAEAIVVTFLAAPVFFIGRLLNVTGNTGVVNFLFMAWLFGIIIATVAATYYVLPIGWVPLDQGPRNIVPWLCLGWGFWLLWLYLRYKNCSLVQQ